MQAIEPPFTREQYESLNPEQKAVIDAAAEYLAGDMLCDEHTDRHISECFNILKPTQGCVPVEEIDEDTCGAIHRKFRAIYQVGINLARKALTEQGLRPFQDFSLTLVIDARRDGASDIVVVDYHRPACHLYEAPKAWEFHFSTLTEIADVVLRVRDRLVQQVLALARPRQTKRKIYVLVQAGMVQKVVDLPDDMELVVLDYDVDDVDEPEQLQLSPVDGELCCMSNF